MSSDFQPAPPAAPVRLPAQEVADAFDRLQAAAFASLIPKRLGRRSYVYAAGHGAALPFSADPERSDAACSWTAAASLSA